MKAIELVGLLAVITVGLVILEGPFALLRVALLCLVFAGVSGFSSWLGRKRR